MDIIIAGAGRVGHLLAKTLCIRHNVTVIDKNPQVLQMLQENIDILAICGDIENPNTYTSLLNKSFDIFICVTDSDEANLLSALISDDVIDVKKKIIRLKNDYFAKSSISQKLGISDAIFPFTSTALSIGALLDFPKANNVKEFMHTDFKLISVFVQSSGYEGRLVREFDCDGCVVVGLEREKNFLLPRNDEIIKEHDLIYFFGDADLIRKNCERIDTKMPQKITKIAIFGARSLGVEIAKVLLERDIQLKVIESDEALCKRASELLQNRATVINSRYNEYTVFEDERINQSDMVIATDTKDEENIIRCLEAKEYGVEKTVAINNNAQHYELMHKLGIVAARGSKSNAYYAILEKIGSSSVIFEKHYCGGRGTVFVRKIFKDSALIDKSASPCFDEDVKSFILRDNRIYPFNERFTLKQNDMIFVFLFTSKEERVKNWIYSL